METIIYLTLLHSLWQGLILAVLTAFILLFTQRAAPSTRYNWLAGALFAYAAGVLTTFITLFAKMPGTAPAHSAIPDAFPQPVAFIELGLPPDVIAWLNANAGYIVWGWVVIVCLKSMKLASGFYFMHRLRRQQTFSAGSHWEEKVLLLAADFGIKQPVKLLQSGLAKVPMTLGYLKPLILLPLGLINGMSEGEVEAIISHELAHIRRKDYLVNLLQSVLEVIFFFNPALLWLNKLIRDERENCCDDLALQNSIGVRDYVSALVSCCERLPLGSKLAMAFAARHGQLARRVSRIVNYGKRSAGRPLGTILLVLLLAGGILVIAFSAVDGQGKRTIVRNTSVDNEHELKEIKEVIVQFPGGAAKPETGCDVLTAGIDSISFAEDSISTLANTATADRCVKPVAPCPEIKDSIPAEVFTEQDGTNMHRELYSDGISGDLGNVSYSLNKDELIVDNHKQPEEIHRKYVARYLVYSNRSITYNYHYKGLP